VIYAAVNLAEPDAEAAGTNTADEYHDPPTNLAVQANTIAAAAAAAAVADDVRDTEIASASCLQTLVSLALAGLPTATSSSMNAVIRWL